MAAKNTFEKEVKKFTLKWDKRKQAFFKKYNSELAKKKLTKTTEINEFWNKIYKPKFEILFKKMNDEYAKIYHQFH